MAVRTLNVDTRAADGRVSQRRSVYIHVRARNGPLFFVIDTRYMELLSLIFVCCTGYKVVVFSDLIIAGATAIRWGRTTTSFRTQ